MATIILFCLSIGYLTVGVGAFLIATATGDFGIGVISLFLAPLIFWPITIVIAFFAFLFLKAKYEFKR